MRALMRDGRKLPANLTVCGLFVVGRRLKFDQIPRRLGNVLWAVPAVFLVALAPAASSTMDDIRVNFV